MSSLPAFLQGIRMWRVTPPLMIACLLAACAASPPKIVHLTLTAAAGLNPDETGLPNPVQTHVYMLSAAETFDNTDYFQLADKEKTVLGSDLLAQANQMLRPGQTRQLTLPVPAGTKMVAVSAAFRNIDKGTWRAVTPLAGKITANFGPETVQLIAPK
jgi:type VI secretion system protein VasD